MYGKSKAIEDAIKIRTGYLLRQIEEWAAQIGISRDDLANRLGSILLLSPQGSAQKEVRPVRVQSTVVGKQLRDLAGHSHPHGGRPRGRPRKVVVSGIKAFWAKMTPEERKAEMKRRGSIRKKKEAA